MSVGPSHFPWEIAIAERAHAVGLELSERSALALAAHARAVLAANERLHLTSVIDPPAFVERHFGEAFEGAAMLPSSATGLLVDLGSGNGFPGIPLAVARPGLEPVLVEASARKSVFLREALVVAGCAHGRVLEKHVVRAADLKDLSAIEVLTTRAMGGWERIVPKLATCLAPAGKVMVWGTIDAESLTGRVAWEKLRIVARRNLPDRARAVIYLFQRASLV